jgi:hypothetical protein
MPVVPLLEQLLAFVGDLGAVMTATDWDVIGVQTR